MDYENQLILTFVNLFWNFCWKALKVRKRMNMKLNSLFCTKNLINEQNILPFVNHTISWSNAHPVPQQISLSNSFSVQRRIPNSEHFCWAFKNVSVKQSGISLLQDVPSIQVNLFQKYLFTCQLTHNMTKNCSMIYEFSTWKFQEQNMSRTCQEHVIYTNRFECISKKYENLTQVSIV